MAQILVQVSDAILEELERVASGASRKRSRFIQLAIQRALMEHQDKSTQEAYRRKPDEGGDDDDAPWDEWKPRALARKRRTSTEAAKR